MLYLIFSEHTTASHANIMTLVFWCVQRILLQEACGLFRYSFANLSCVTIFLFERKVFFSGQSFQTNHTCSIYFGGDFGVQKIELVSAQKGTANQ